MFAWSTMSLCGPAAASGLTARPLGAQVRSPDDTERPVREKQEYSPPTGKLVLTSWSDAPVTNDRCTDDDDDHDNTLLQVLQEVEREMNEGLASPEILDGQDIYGEDSVEDYESWQFANDDDDDIACEEDDDTWSRDDDDAPLWHLTTNEITMTQPFIARHGLHGARFMPAPSAVALPDHDGPAV